MTRVPLLAIEQLQYQYHWHLRNYSIFARVSDNTFGRYYVPEIRDVLCTSSVLALALLV